MSAKTDSTSLIHSGIDNTILLKIIYNLYYQYISTENSKLKPLKPWRRRNKEKVQSIQLSLIAK